MNKTTSYNFRILTDNSQVRMTVTFAKLARLNPTRLTVYKFHFDLCTRDFLFAQIQPNELRLANERGTLYRQCHCVSADVSIAVIRIIIILVNIHKRLFISMHFSLVS